MMQNIFPEHRSLLLLIITETFAFQINSIQQLFHYISSRIHFASIFGSLSRDRS